MKLSLRIAGVVVLALSCSVFSSSQTTLGVISGSVTDSSGAVVTGATVSVQRSEGGEARTDTVVTSVNVRLSVGTTTEMVTVDASAEQVQTDNGELDAVIPTVQIRDLPIVSGNPYALAVTLPGVSQPDQRDNFTNGFGFSVNGLRPRDNNFLLDGFDNNDYSITGQALQPTNQEAVSTVTVLENAYTPEYGRGGSVSNLTYKSGTNSFHGSAWEQYGGSALDAVTAEQQASGLTSSPHQVNNLFGFTVGGPVIKNKLFLFGTSQWTHDIGAETSASTLTIPTASGIANLQSVLAGAAPGSPTANNTQVLLTSLGGLVAPTNNAGSFALNDEPGCTGCSVPFGTLTRSDSGRSLSYEWTVRADYTASEQDQIFARFTNTRNSLSPDLFANPSALPSQDTQQGGPARNLGIFWSHSFSQSVLNEFRFSQQTIGFTFAPLGATVANSLANDPTAFFADSFGGGVVGIGGFSQGVFPQGRAHQTWQFQDDVAVVKGKHNIKVGTDFAILLVTDEIPFNSNGLANITGGGSCTFNGVAGTCSDLANYVDGFTGPAGTANISKQFGNPKISTPTTQQAYYFEDTWRLRPDFTLNYGVRYEYQPLDAENVLPFPAVDRNTVLTNPLQTAIEVKPYRNAWGPRLGFAYSPQFWQGLFGQNKTVIRAGAGVFYDSFFTNISNNTASTSPNTLGGTQTGADAANDPINPSPRGIPDFMTAIASITPTVDPRNTIDSVFDNERNPRIYEWNLNVQRELPGGLLAQVAYVGTRATGEFDNEQLNPIQYPGTLLAGGQRLNPNKGSIVVRGNRGDSIYHGLQTEVKRNVGKLSLQASYTWSRAIDNGSEVFTNSGGSSFWQNVFDPRSDRGPSAFNHTNVASFTWVYALPGPSKGFLGQVLGGWESAGSIILQSGAPETLYFGGLDVNGDGQGNDRPSLVNPSVRINVPACLSNPSCTSTGIALLDPADAAALGAPLIDLFTGAPVSMSQVHYLAIAGKNGNIGRNSIDLPGLETYNLSVFKNFKMPYAEGHQLQLRADFFNAFNHFNAGQNNISGYGNLLNPGDGFLGGNNLTLDGGRAIQIWMKYSF